MRLFLRGPGGASVDTLWIARADGAEARELHREEPGFALFGPRFSPDGRLIAVTVDPRPPDIWIVDPARRQATRLTTDGGNIRAIWSPDGERIAFAGRGGPAWSSRNGDERRTFTGSAAKI